VAALKVLLDDDLIYVHSNGRIDGKAEYLETLRQGTIHYATTTTAVPLLQKADHRSPRRE
jgi:hypothetical protein